MKIFTKSFQLFVIFVLFSLAGFSQTATKLQLLDFTANGQFPANVPIVARVAAVSNNMMPDNTFVGNVTIKVLSGPGVLYGDTVQPINNGTALFNDFSLKTVGIYKLIASCPGLLSDTIENVNIINMLTFTNTVGTKTWMANSPDTTMKNEPMILYVASTSADMVIDTTDMSQVTLSLEGSSQSAFSGNKTMNFNKGIAIFENMQLTQTGKYKIVSTHSSMISDTTKEIVVNEMGGNQLSNATKLLFVNEPDTVNAFSPFNLEAHATDNMGVKDINFSDLVTITRIEGKGNHFNLSNQYANSGQLNFNNLYLDSVGIHKFVISSGQLIKDTVTIYAKFSNVGYPVKVRFDMEPDTVPVNVPFGFKANILDAYNNLCEAYMGNVAMDKISGVGSPIGSISAPVNHGFGIVNFKLDQKGDYVFQLRSGTLDDDTISFRVDSMAIDPGVGCNTQQKGARVNLGLYTGDTYDLAWTNTTKRIFAAVETPSSVFISDDTCKTWYKAFPFDSLEFECGNRGWGGGCVKILYNQTGWVLTENHQQGGTLNSAVASYQNGDTTTWFTALDQKVLTNKQFQSQNITAIGLSDYWAYIGATRYLARINPTNPFSQTSVVFNSETSPGFNVNQRVEHIATVNTASGYPVYLGIKGNGQNSERLYLFNGTNATNIPLPANSCLKKIFTHPAQVTADTVFVSVYDTVQQKLRFHRSFNGGLTWTDISPSSNYSFDITDCDYNPQWVALMPQSNGLRLGFPGFAVSTNLGSNWTMFQGTNNGGAAHPNDPNMVLSTSNRGVAVSSTGVTGQFQSQPNVGLEAVRINMIDRTAHKGAFYLATNSGVAYTTAYLNNAVVGPAKWEAPYGQFPVTNTGSCNAVAINPWDSLNVIAGHSWGFYVTTTGATGFQNLAPANWNSTSYTNPFVTDIDFIDSVTVLASTGNKFGSAQQGVSVGNIWRSTDKGLTWTVVVNSQMKQITSMAVARTATDTVIYAACGHDGGGTNPVPGSIWKSTNKGISFVKTSDGPACSGSQIQFNPVYDIAVDPRGTDTVYIAACTFAYSTDGGATFTVDPLKMGAGNVTCIAVNLTHPDTVYAAIDREIYAYDFANHHSTNIFIGLPGEKVPDLISGSILAGTSTGFFKIIESNITVSSDPIENAINSKELVCVYPNPFSDYTTVLINVDDQSYVTAKLYDILGKEVMVVLDNQKIESSKKLQINAASLSKGTYFLKVITNSKQTTKKLMIIN
ncbi:MAG: T9SS type A sorting domain-containing protein [Bacteroidota bacterium]